MSPSVDTVLALRGKADVRSSGKDQEGERHVAFEGWDRPTAAVRLHVQRAVQTADAHQATDVRGMGVFFYSRNTVSMTT